MKRLTRRDFVKQTLLAGTAIGLAGCISNPFTRQGSALPYKLGVQGALTMDCTLGEEIDILGRLGYEYIELRDWKLETFLKERKMADLHRLMDQAGIRPINLSAIELDCLGPGPKREKWLERLHWYFRMARETGSPNCLFVHFAPAEDGLSREEVLLRALDDLKFVADVAAKYNVRALYEFLGSPKLPIYNVADTMTLLREAAHPNLGWVFDFYQFYVTDGDLQALEQADMKSLHEVHICDAQGLPKEQLWVPQSQRALPGDGVCPLEDYLGTLARMGYRGPFVIELYSPQYMESPAEEYARQAKVKTDAALKKYFRA